VTWSPLDIATGSAARPQASRQVGQPEPRVRPKEVNVPNHINSDQPKHDYRVSVARTVLAAGGGFATTIATILGVAGRWQVSDRATLWALCALCVVVAITMFIVALLMGRQP
jgi:hypothetical protein